MQLLPCAWKQLLGISCPFCGFQRAVLLLRKGEVWASIMMFPPLLPLMGCVCLIPVLYYYRQRTALKIVWSIVLFCLFLNGIYQNIVH